MRLSGTNAAEDEWPGSVFGLLLNTSTSRALRKDTSITCPTAASQGSLLPYLTSPPMPSWPPRQAFLSLRASLTHIHLQLSFSVCLVCSLFATPSHGLLNVIRLHLHQRGQNTTACQLWRPRTYRCPTRWHPCCGGKPAILKFYNVDASNGPQSQSSLCPASERELPG